MEIEGKDLLTWGGTAVAVLAQWFHLKNRVSLLELKQDRDREMQVHEHEQMTTTLDRIFRKLDAIDRKLDSKADK